MPSIFKTIVNISIWMLFIKGVLAACITVYTVIQAYVDGETTQMVGVISCMAGTFAFIMTCIAVWIRRKIE